MEEESCGVGDLEEIQYRGKMEGLVDREGHYFHCNKGEKEKRCLGTVSLLVQRQKVQRNIFDVLISFLLS